MEFLQALDWSVLHFLRDNIFCGFLDFLMPVISFIGNNGLIWLLICAFLIAFPKYRNSSLLILTGLLAGLIIGNGLMKNIFMRPRPCWIEEVNLLIPLPEDYSFPSGHALSSFIAAALLTFSNRKFAFFAYPLAVLIAFSRLYLYVHFPSDVVFSMLLGTVIALIIIFVYKKPAVQKRLKSTGIVKRKNNM